ncbi:MAG: VWA domain-containing protein [Lachnospiraceae bacterium]|nr:VWA domain-containing protein [Lachnospiraceae bacterium]
MKNGKKVLIFIISILVLLLIAVNIFLYWYKDNFSKRVSEQLELGQQYLLDMDYEQAIAAYEVVIELEPKNTEAYFGMADAYLAMGEPQKAVKILKRGYRETGDEEMKELYEELEAELNREQSDLNIVQIDTGDFPNITVYFSLEDLEGNFIRDIQPQQIQVLESNADKEWAEVAGSLSFSEEDVSKRSVEMVMDISGSMDNSIAQLCKAAQELLNQMQGGNYDVSLTVFDDRWETLVDYTSNIQAVSNELNNLYTGGGTALYDTLENSLYQAINQQGQKYILAFTDGEDNSSSITKDELISLANYYHVPIYIIMEMNQAYWTQDMEEIARESGGEFYAISSIDELYDLYYDIFQFQENLYSFRYTTEQADSECGIRVVYNSKQYNGESESKFISQKPMKRERVSNSAIMEIEASSSRQGYPLENAFDSDDDTMWAEGVRGNGIGEYIRISLDEAHELNGISIRNGNRNNSDDYEKYGRIKIIQVTFSDGSQRQFELDDNYYEPCQVNFINPVRTDSLKIEILDVYEGTTYQDTCIAGISIN